MGAIRIETASEADLPLLADVEQRASTLFRETPFAAEVSQAVLPIEWLAAQRQRGLVWVAKTESDEIAGFAAGMVFGSYGHLHELSVDPEFGRRGIGARLLHAAIDAFRERKLQAVTLSTFRTIPWNAPFYAQHGFQALSPGEMPPHLRRIREQEREHGLPAEERAGMLLRFAQND